MIDVLGHGDTMNSVNNLWDDPSYIFRWTPLISYLKHHLDKLLTHTSLGCKIDKDLGTFKWRKLDLKKIARCQEIRKEKREEMMKIRHKERNYKKTSVFNTNTLHLSSFIISQPGKAFIYSYMIKTLFQIW